MSPEGLEKRPISFSFTKKERLSSLVEIKTLFNSKSSGFIYPFKFLFLPVNGQSQHQILISVPKKLFKRSVDRHLITRRIREAYRLNKHKLQSPVFYNIAFIYVAKNICSFKEIEKKLNLVLENLNKQENESNAK